MANTDTNQTDYYALLGVAMNAEIATIKQAYRGALLRAHPDKQTQSLNQWSTTPTVAITQLQEAFRTLSDPKLRASYDELLNEGKGMFTLSAVVQRPAHEVSLDEFTEEEIKGDGNIMSQWTYLCRCGGQFIVEEAQLEEGVHYIGCGGCSEVIWVGYEEVDDVQGQEGESEF